MIKTLHSLTNEELWHLFPIILQEHKPEWKDRYNTESKRIQEAFSFGIITCIQHIGSTSVPGLLAKPTIDILIQIDERANPYQFIKTMEGLGYIYSPQPTSPPPHMMFLKGYTPLGFQGQAYHVHIRYPGDWDESCFRDYLIAHPETALKYAKLKLKLEKKYKYNRDGYTAAKSDFIKEVMKKARE